MRISDWSSDVCSSDLARGRDFHHDLARSSFWTRRFSDPKHLRSAKPSDFHSPHYISPFRRWSACVRKAVQQWLCLGSVAPCHVHDMRDGHVRNFRLMINLNGRSDFRSEEHTSELQSLMRISYAVFCLKKIKPTNS